MAPAGLSLDVKTCIWTDKEDNFYFFTSNLAFDNLTFPIQPTFTTTDTPFESNSSNSSLTRPPWPHLFAGDALLGRVDEELLQQVQGLLRGVGQDLAQRDRRVRRERDLVVVRQLRHALRTKNTCKEGPGWDCLSPAGLDWSQEEGLKFRP